MQTLPPAPPDAGNEASEFSGRAAGLGQSPGRYLVRSGSAYLFQIRVPAGLAKHRTHIRIGLGTPSLGLARRLADDLAAQARVLFNETICRRLEGSDSGTGQAGPDMPGGPDAAGDVADIRLRLKAFLSHSETQGRHGCLGERKGIHDDRASDFEKKVKQLARDALEELLLEAADRIRERALTKLANTDQPLHSAKRPRPNLTSSKPVKNPRGGLEGVSSHRGCQATQTRPSEAKDGVGLAELGRKDKIPAFLMDRRTAVRAQSSAPNFSTVIEDYLMLRVSIAGGRLKDINSARARLLVFLDLIGNHPVDRYEAADLQAFVLLMADWPAKPKLRRNKTTLAVLEEARLCRYQPISEKSLRDGYVATIRAAMRSGLASYPYRDPFQSVFIRYPSSLARSRHTVALSARQLTTVFRLGVQSGYMGEAMLPLLSHLTGRRLSALVYLRGSDILEKYPGIWIARPQGSVEIDGRQRRVPIKTNASATFFVLHCFFYRIGFIQWAVSRGDEFLFPDLIRLEDPSKSASQYMQRLFKRAGIPPGTGEVFHSLRGDCIEELRDHKISTRTIKLQVGHAVGLDEHARYGSHSIREVQAIDLANVPLKVGVDYTVFEGLDFGKISGHRRRKGVRTHPGA